MKLLRTIIVFDKGDLRQTSSWQRSHESYAKAIRELDFPLGSGSLTIREISTDPTTGKKKRNGVSYLKNRFVECMKRDEWLTEAPVHLKSGHDSPLLVSYPQQAEHIEPITSNFGGFDFTSEAKDGTRVALEWETGNISSSHRSLNKLTLALANEDIQIGVLIVPSREMYFHLTDRVGNINELSPYLSFWNRMSHIVPHGLLAITVVEHDALTTDPSHPYLKVGMDGRAREAQEKLI